MDYASKCLYWPQHLPKRLLFSLIPHPYIYNCMLSAAACLHKVSLSLPVCNNLFNWIIKPMFLRYSDVPCLAMLWISTTQPFHLSLFTVIFSAVLLTLYLSCSLVFQLPLCALCIYTFCSSRPLCRNLFSCVVSVKFLMCKSVVCFI
jgi:hypothetical protein